MSTNETSRKKEVTHLLSIPHATKEESHPEDQEQICKNRTKKGGLDYTNFVLAWSAAYRRARSRSTLVKAILSAVSSSSHPRQTNTHMKIISSTEFPNVTLINAPNASPISLATLSVAWARSPASGMTATQFSPNTIPPWIPSI